MNKSKSLLRSFIIVLLISSVTQINTGCTHALSPATTIYIDPLVATATPSANFTVNIEVSNVEYLYSWQFYLNWTPGLLEIPDDPTTQGVIEGLTEGPFLNQEGAVRTASISSVNNTQGLLSAACSLSGVIDPLAAPSGSGTLASVTFIVKAEGECRLHFYNQPPFISKLSRIKSPNEPVIVRIPHTTEDGYFKYPLPKLYLEPSRIINSTLTSGSNFTININAIDVGKEETPQYLYAWQFFLNWNPDILNATTFTEGSFLNQNGTYTTDFLSETNQTEGYLHANCTLLGDVPGASGNGTLATVTFLVEAIGSTPIDLDRTELVDSENASIIHVAEDGLFNNAVRDIAVTKVDASPTTVKVGDLVTINVTVRNQGVSTETSIDVSVETPFPPSPSYNVIGTTQTISSLSPKDETTLTFSWDTKDVTKGEYTIRALASTVPGEINTENNVLDMEGTVKVTTPQELPTTLIIGVVIAVVVIVIAILLFTRRKSPKT